MKDKFGFGLIFSTILSIFVSFIFLKEYAGSECVTKGRIQYCGNEAVILIILFLIFTIYLILTIIQKNIKKKELSNSIDN